MKTTQLLSLGLLLSAGFLLTACSNDDGVSDDSPAGSTWMLTVKANKGGTALARQSSIDTRALTLSGNTLNATWNTSEHVYVRYNNEWHGALQPNSNTSSTILTGSLTDFAVLPSVNFSLELLFPRKSLITYEGQQGTLADIAANFDWATATAEITNIDNNAKILNGGPVTFQNQQAIVKFTLKNGENTLPVKSLRVSATNLKINESYYGDVTITPTDATSELYAALSGINNSQVTLTATTSDDKVFIYKRQNATFANSKYYAITSVKMREVTYPVALSAVTDDYIGSVVGANGEVYPSRSAAEAAQTTAVAMVAYVSGTGNGLAISLANESEDMNQTTATSNWKSKTAVTGGTWRLPTNNDWYNMIYGCGAKSAVDNIVNYTCFKSKLYTAAGTDMSGRYWCSDGTYCLEFSLYGHELNLNNTMDSGTLCHVRYCLAF